MYENNFRKLKVSLENKSNQSDRHMQRGFGTDNGYGIQNSYPELMKN